MSAEKPESESDVSGLRFRRAEVRKCEIGPIRHLKPPFTASPYRDWGTQLLALERFGEAAEVFRKAGRVAPYDTLCDLQLGFAYYAEGRIKDAQDTYASLVTSQVRPPAELHQRIQLIEARRIAQSQEIARRLLERIRKDPRRVEAKIRPGLRGLLDLTIPDIRTRFMREIEKLLALGGGEPVNEGALDRVLVDHLVEVLTAAGNEQWLQGLLTGTLVVFYTVEVDWGYSYSCEGIFRSYYEDYRTQISCISSVSAGVLARLTVLAVDGSFSSQETPVIRLRHGERLFEGQLHAYGSEFDTEGLLALMNKVVDSMGDSRRFRFIEWPKGERFGWIMFLRPAQFAHVERGLESMWKSMNRREL